jgi:tetratricopeptide (TPR) repeat protein
VFAPPIRKKGEAEEHLFTLLCDAYDELGQKPEKEGLIKQVIDHVGKSTLRSGAWQRLAMIRIDRSDAEGAWEAYKQAQRDDPSSPNLALLEVQLLMVDYRLEEAAARAKFWLKSFARRGDYDSPMVDLLTMVADDPEQAMLGLRGGSEFTAIVDRLSQWVSEHIGRRMPKYTVELLGDETAPEGFFIPPVTVSKIQVQWFRAMSSNLGEEADMWDPQQADDWLTLLEKKPAAINSLDIIEDLVGNISQNPFFVNDKVQDEILVPLLERAILIINKILKDYPDMGFPWLCRGNRPMLRLLLTKAVACNSLGDMEQERNYLECLLKLSPNDNQGARVMLMGCYLSGGDIDAALNLASQFPNDMFAEVCYGEVLAHLKRNDTDSAKVALALAYKRLPKVAEYLLKPIVEKPELSEHGVTIGGDDQAYRYRQDALPIWQEAPGALAWLKQEVKPLRKE